MSSVSMFIVCSLAVLSCLVAHATSAPLPALESMKGSSDDGALFHEPKRSALDDTAAFRAEHFEGDLKLPQSVIDKYYKKPAKGVKRDVMTDDRQLWPANTVIYAFDKSVSTSIRQLILAAMADISALSCIKFAERTSQTGYIKFQNAGLNSGCYSDSIGYSGGVQTINLEYTTATAASCAYKGIATHEILHSLGFWHEQSRPDRDNYIQTNPANMQSGTSDQFAKRAYADIDFQASGYDYGSIMHYPLTAFSSNGKNTMTITNTAEFQKQSPVTVGQRDGMSTRDTQQLNRLYYCPGTGVSGRLVVNVLSAFNLPSVNTGVSALVTAVSGSGGKVQKSTSSVSGQTFQINQVLDFGTGSWQFFRVDLLPTQVALQSQTFLITSQGTTQSRYCSNEACSAYVDLSFTVGDGGAPVTQPTATPSPVTPSPVTPAPSTTPALTIRALNASNLPNKDGNRDRSDPYMQITAKAQDGSTMTLSTNIIQDTLSPKWNQDLSFGKKLWTGYTISIYDYDTPTKSDILLGPYSFASPPKGTYKDQGYRITGTTTLFFIDVSFV